jgi:acetyl esterase
MTGASILARMPIDPQLVEILKLASDPEAPQLHELPLSEARSLAAAGPMGAVPPPLEPVAAVEEHSLPGPDTDLALRLYRPHGEGPFGVLLFLHGGGFVLPLIPAHDGICRALCRRAGVVVASLDYRLAPEHPFPAAVDDAWAALSWLVEHADALGLDARRIALGGDSAGGNLATVIAQLARARAAPEIAFQVLVYPIADATLAHPSVEENGEGFLLTRALLTWFLGHYLPDGTDRSDPRCSPLHAASLEGLPPALVITAELDPLRDEGEAYARRLIAAGVPVTLTRYAGLIHGSFQLYGVLDGGRAMLDQCVDALRAAIAGGPR